MALLLAMFQKLRLKREYNQCALKATTFSSKISRGEKNIQRAQKRYESLFAQIDSQAKMMTSQAKMAIQNGFGLGVNGTSSLTSLGGLSGFVMNAMGAGLAQASNWCKDKDGNSLVDDISSDKFQQMMQVYMQTGGRFNPEYEEGEDGNPTSTITGYGDFTKEEVQAFYSALQRAQQMQSQAQMQANNMATQYENNVSIWVEAQKAQLEAEQDAVLEPLNYEQTMLELDKELNDTKMTRIKAEMESYDQLVSEEAKNSAPTFGLR